MSDRVSRVVALVLILWLAAAAVIGLTGVFKRGPVQIVPATIVSLTVLTLICAAVIRPLREWLMVVDMRLLVGFHVSRFVGIAFLIYARRGLMPEKIAEPAGWGDIAVAITALLVIGVLSMPLPRKPRSLIAWNLFGMIDILMVIISGFSYALHDPSALAPMRSLPMSLLPTFLVPLIIATHVIIFIRIWRERADFVERRDVGA
jgi:hypothetical protein